MHLEVVTPELRRKSCRARPRFRSRATSTPSPRRSRSSAEARSRPTSSRASAIPREAILAICETARRARRLSVRRALRADLGHAARKPRRRRRPNSCTRILEPARRNARRERGSRRPTSRRDAASAAPARRSRPTSGGSRHDLRAVRTFQRQRVPRQVRRLALGARRRLRAEARRCSAASRALFGQDDRDAVDDYAITLVALVHARRRGRPGRRHGAHSRGGAGPVVGLAARGGPRVPAHRRDRRDPDPARRLVGACDGLPNLPRACAGAERAAVPVRCTGRRWRRSSCTVGRI